MTREKRFDRDWLTPQTREAFRILAEDICRHQYAAALYPPIPADRPRPARAHLRLVKKKRTA